MSRETIQINLQQHPSLLSQDIANILEHSYYQRVNQQCLEFDALQLQALRDLQLLLNGLFEINRVSGRLPLLSKVLSPRPKPLQSLYIYGDVGRGKSMLMDLFFEAVPLVEKRRVFFHTFMLEVHSFIHHWQKQKKSGAIDVFAKRLTSSLRLLCFDEFHVTDIADAMILKRLFSQLLTSGMAIVITSNRHPKLLYQGGLQKQQFLSFSEFLQQATKVIELNAKIDYRLSFEPAHTRRYYFPLDSNAHQFINQHYQALTGSCDFQSRSLPLNGRELQIKHALEGIALITFADLCEQPLGSADYLLLAKQFSTLLLTNIPQLNSNKRNEAKRFVTLIDVLYEHKVKLICTAEVSVEALYIEGDGVFEFKRCVSRLNEMQSANYWQQRR